MTIPRISKAILALLSFALVSQLLCLAIALFSSSGDFSGTSSAGATYWLGLSVPDYWQWAEPILAHWQMNSLLWLKLPNWLAYVLLTLIFIRLFILYNQGVIFSLRSVKCFQQCGVLLFCWSLLQMGYPALLVKLGNTYFATEHLAVFSISDQQILLVIIALIVYAIGQVMQQGLMIKQENELVI